MNKIYSALDISKYIISYLSQRNIHVTNLKLQKLLYFIQAYSFKIKNCMMFSEDIEAWQYGPVIPRVYHEYKWAGGARILLNEDCTCAIKDETDIQIINEVLDNLGNIDSRTLVDITHNYETWKDAINNSYYRTIEKNKIKMYHQNKEEKDGYYF